MKKITKDEIGLAIALGVMMLLVVVIMQFIT